jgi:hypothetical protein
VQSNVVVVTAPDYYFADAPSILCIGCDAYADTIVDNLRRADVPVTVYLTTSESDIDWICSAYFQSEISILNCAYNDFLLGFFIDKERIYYYNNTESYKRFNFNEVADPIEPLIKWMAKWQDNTEKNAAYM